MAIYIAEVDDDNEDCSVTAELKSIIKEGLKQLLTEDEEDMELEDEALNMVVEAAKCLVKDTCLRASNLALLEGCTEVNAGHMIKVLPQLKQDYM